MFSLRPGHARAHRADAAHHEVHLHSRLRRAVQRVDGLLVHDRVDLELDPGFLAFARPVGLGVDQVDQPGAHRRGRDQQAAELRLGRVARQLVEELGEVGADIGVLGQQAVVLVQPCGARVVVAGADVAVAVQAVVLLAHHEQQLAVRLEAHQAVHHVHAGLLKFAGPRDVALLVEPRLDLDQREHLLAVARRLDQGVDDGRVARGAVQRLLDGQHLGVGGGLRQEGLHRRGERVVRVVQQHVGAADRLEHVLLVGGLHGRQLVVRGGTEGGELQAGPVEVRDHVEPAQVQWRGQLVDVRIGDAELAHQQFAHLGRAGPRPPPGARRGRSGAAAVPAPSPSGGSRRRPPRPRRPRCGSRGTCSGPPPPCRGTGSRGGRR